MQLPRPAQISTDSGVNASAMQWANLLLTALEQVLNGSVASGVNADTLDGIDSLGFLKLVGAGGNFHIAAGTATIVFTANPKSAQLTVTHGMGLTPLYVVATPGGLMAVAAGPVLAVGNLGATTFDVVGYDTDAVARTGNVLVYWMAIG